MAEIPYDALLVLSFGGPEEPDHVMPFLENVLRGKNVPRERMMEVAEHYLHFGGKSPINDQNRALIAALREKITLPIYWGNRNWHPLLSDTLREMRDQGVRRALAFVTSAFSSYSGCRQYREDVARAQAEVGEGAPEVHKLRGFFNHPGFIETMIDRVNDALKQIPDSEGDPALLFTAHSIPLSMASTSDYVAQLNEACGLIAAGLGRPSWKLVYQSRSGPPSQPWLEPDIGEALREVQAAGTRAAVVTPLGFISDHMEVLFDLDTEALELSHSLGLHMVRAATAGTHPKFVAMICELIEERMNGGERLSLGKLGPRPDFCPEGCCPAPAPRPHR